VALTVSSAEATPFVVGGLTCGGHHLSTDDSGHLRANTAPANGSRPSAHEEVLTPVLATGGRTRPSRKTDTAPAAYDMLCDPSVRPAAREGPWTWPTCVRCDRRPCGGRTATPRPGSRWQFASSVRLVDALLPRMLKEEAGRLPIQKAGHQLSLPSSPARMMNILEAEGKGEATARLALPRLEKGAPHCLNLYHVFLFPLSLSCHRDRERGYFERILLSEGNGPRALLLIRGSKVAPYGVRQPPRSTRAPSPLLIRGSKAGPSEGFDSRPRACRVRDDPRYVRYMAKARATLLRYPRTFPRLAGTVRN
jgi:hypothetical protein